MDSRFIKFLEASKILVSDTTIKDKIICSAIAASIANDVHIPTSCVDDPASYFNLNLSIVVNKALSKWNEETVFDIKECLEQIRALWLVRYYAAYPGNKPFFIQNARFFESIFHIQALVSPELYELLNTKANEILILAGTVSEINEECKLFSDSVENFEQKTAAGSGIEVKS